MNTIPMRLVVPGDMPVADLCRALAMRGYTTTMRNGALHVIRHKRRKPNTHTTPPDAE